MISDSAALQDADVWFLHIQFTGRNVRLPKQHKILPEVDFKSSASPVKSDIFYKMIPIDNAVSYYPHDNIVGSLEYDECVKWDLLIVCRMPESIW